MTLSDIGLQAKSHRELTCLPSLIVTFVSSFRTLTTLARFSLAHDSNVHRSRLCLSHGNRTRNRNHFASEICPFLQLVDTHQQVGFQQILAI